MNVASLQEQLRERAFLHDDPEAYLAGVKDAVSVLVPEVEAEANGGEPHVESA